MNCVSCIGAEVRMNDFGGACTGAGEKVLSCAVGFDCVCTILCTGVGGIAIGETVDPCCGVPVELEVDSGNFGLTAILGSSEVPGSALIFSCVGLIEFWVVDVGVMGVCDGLVARLFGGLFASEKPH